MRDRVFGWSYPPGAGNDPMAPYNQDSCEDECFEYQWQTMCQRLQDEPDAWISEAITQQMDKTVGLYAELIGNLTAEESDDAQLGRIFRKLVWDYAMPNDNEAYEAVTEELANKMADAGDYYGPY